jgi:hypothetical protein
MQAMAGLASLMADPEAAWPPLWTQAGPSQTLPDTFGCCCFFCGCPTLQVLTVLVLTVQTGATKQLNTKSLCSLLQVSAACRQALQSIRGQHKVSITGRDVNAAVSGFSAWLPNWAGLVAELHLQPAPTHKIEALSQEAGLNLFQDMQECADPNSAGTAAGAARSMPLLLTGFSTAGSRRIYLWENFSESLLLAPLSLTRLEFGHVDMWVACLPAALLRLSNLAHLKLACQGAPFWAGLFITSLKLGWSGAHVLGVIQRRVDATAASAARRQGSPCCGCDNACSLSTPMATAGGPALPGTLPGRRLGGTVHSHIGWWDSCRMGGSAGVPHAAVDVTSFCEPACALYPLGARGDVCAWRV